MNRINTRINTIKVVLVEQQPGLLRGIKSWFDEHERYRVSVYRRKARSSWSPCSSAWATNSSW